MNKFSSTRRRFLSKIGGSSIGAALVATIFNQKLALAAGKPLVEQGSQLTGNQELGSRYFDDFLPNGHNPDTDDASVAFEKAAKWSARTGQSVIVRGNYVFSNVCQIGGNGVKVIFEGAYIRIRDDGYQQATRFGKRFPIGLYVTGNNISLLGKCTFEGMGVPGQTFLHGLYFEELEHLTLGQFTVKNMAVGLHFMCCDFVNCGDTVAHSMWGLQVTSSGSTGAGSAQAISGCRWSQFGKLHAFDNDKPARYLAVGKMRTGESRDNISNRYGFASVTGRKGSPWAQVTGIRSSVNSSFEGGHGERVSFLLLCQKYSTDNDYSIDGNDFGSWTGEIIDSPGSVDAAGYFWVADDAKPIGRNRVSTIRAKSDIPDYSVIKKLGIGMPQTFGLYCSSGDLEIGSLDFDGFTFHIYSADSRLNIGLMSSRNAGFQLVRYGRGLTGSIGRIDVLSDLAGYALNAGLIRPVSAGKSRQDPKFKIVEINCEEIEGEVRAQYLVYDNVYDVDAMQVGSVRGSCTPGHGYWRGQEIRFEDSLISSSREPSGNWPDGQAAINSNSASGEAAGWIKRDGKWWSFGRLE